MSNKISQWDRCDSVCGGNKSIKLGFFDIFLFFSIFFQKFDKKFIFLNKNKGYTPETQTSTSSETTGTTSGSDT